MKYEAPITTSIPAKQLNDIMADSTDIVLSIDSNLNIKILNKEKYIMIKTLEQLRADLIGLIGELKAKDLDAEIAEKVKEFSDKLKSEIAEKTAAEIANAEINLKFVESKIAEQNAEITDEPEPESVKEE